MGYARVQSAQVAPAIIFGDSTEDITLGASVTSGNLVVVCVGSENNVRTLNVPTASNITFARIGAANDPEGGPGELAMFWGIATGAFTVITCTTSGPIGTDNSWIWAGEFSGNADSMTPTNNKASLSGTTNHDSGSVIPNTESNLIVAFMSAGNADWTRDADFTVDANGDFGSAERHVSYLIQAAATTQNYIATSDINRDSLLIAAAFDGSGAALFDGARLSRIVSQPMLRGPY